LRGRRESGIVTESVKESNAMRRLITAAILLAIVFAAPSGRAEWKMRVHEGATVTEFVASEVDSVTFYNDLAPAMVMVPDGSFVMGDGVATCGIDERTVTLTRAFHLGQHEVTNQEYVDALQWAYDQGYVTATSASVADNLDGSTEELVDLDDPDCEIAFGGGVFSVQDAGHGVNPDHPVHLVTWYGAVRYCDWLSMLAGHPRAYEHTGDWACNGGDPYSAQGYRLPTDAEWEYAAQFNDDRIYPWGNDPPNCSRANYAACAIGWSQPVGSYPDAPAVLGLSDIAGNVWEWTNDWYTCDLGTSPVTDPPGQASGFTRVLRGASWLHGDLRSALRHGHDPADPENNHGLRVARTVGP
jgi:formylglycine-generating enzyme required for sulfatase activity